MVVFSAPSEDSKLTEEMNKRLKEHGVEAMVNASKEFEVIVDKEDLEETKDALDDLAVDENLEMEVIE